MHDLTGGCLCGAVRYTLRETPRLVTLCHCAMCRRSVGAQSVTWATLPRAAVELLGEERLTWHRSSSRAQRAFCGACGSSLLFAAEAFPDELDVTVGTLDAPHACPPTCHIFVPDKVAWVSLEPELPRHVGDSSSPRLP
ncbi:MAG TPA: GFA family protein [Polyangiales bacterium]